MFIPDGRFIKDTESGLLVLQSLTPEMAAKFAGMLNYYLFLRNHLRVVRPTKMQLVHLELDFMQGVVSPPTQPSVEELLDAYMLTDIEKGVLK